VFEAATAHWLRKSIVTRISQAWLLLRPILVTGWWYQEWNSMH